MYLLNFEINLDRMLYEKGLDYSFLLNSGIDEKQFAKLLNTSSFSIANPALLKIASLLECKVEEFFE